MFTRLWCCGLCNVAQLLYSVVNVVKPVWYVYVLFSSSFSGERREQPANERGGPHCSHWRCSEGRWQKQWRLYRLRGICQITGVRCHLSSDILHVNDNINKRSAEKRGQTEKLPPSCPENHPFNLCFLCPSRSIRVIGNFWSFAHFCSLLACHTFYIMSNLVAENLFTLVI